MQLNTQRSLKKTCSTVHMTLDWDEGSPFNNLTHATKTMLEWLRDKSLNVIEWPSQSPDLTLIEYLWSGMKMAIHRCSSTNMIELVETCQEE